MLIDQQFEHIHDHAYYTVRTTDYGHVLKIYLQSFIESVNEANWIILSFALQRSVECCVNSSNSPDKMLFREFGLHWKERPISLKFNLFFIEYQEEKRIMHLPNEWHGSLYNLQSYPIFRKGALSIANLEVWNHSTSHEHLNLSAFRYKFLSRKDWFIV